MKIKPIYIPFLVAFILIAGISIGITLTFIYQATTLKTTSENRNKLNRLIHLIENEYVDEIDTDSIVNIALNGILEQLDPHSVYIDPENYEYIEENMRGNFVGIGINFYVYKDTLTVIRTIENGPSEKAGLKAGDRILTADNDTIFGKKLASDALVAKLKGVKDSEVALRVFRKADNKFYNFNVKRDVIPLKSVDVGLQLDENTGYIKINRFAETTYTEFKTALEKLNKLNINKLIVDLRDNGGGYVDAAILIADDFLENGKRIVSTKYKKGEEENTYATSEGLYEQGELFILINENSASSSEIIAGAIQDNDRGTIIGRRSFGKGLVQRESYFGDGSAVRLTVARYYTPTGRSIQKDYSDRERYFYHYWDETEETKDEDIPLVDSLKFYTPQGKIVYGGGGIYPDIYIADDEMEDESVLYMMNSALASNFVFETIDKNRNNFQNLTLDALEEKLKANHNYYTEFRNFLNRQNIHLSSLDENRKIIEKYLKAEFIRQLFSEETYYKSLLQEDVMVKKVFEM
ncbi:MAG: S41 family peptidase [Flavobacteriaceae bacterium]